MAKVKINCPHCKAWLEVSESQIGKKDRCERCGEQFVISQTEDNQKPVSPEKSAQSEPQAIYPAEAKLQQVVAPGFVETIAASSSGRSGNDIAQTIAAPRKKEPEEIHKAEQDVPVEWEEGQTILDIYEVKQVHRTGGMGLIYRVHHKNWNMDLAVKSPRADYFKAEAQKENFIRECETWTDLGLHPNIVSCFYVRTLGGVPRVFAEYVEGGSLKDWIDDKKLYEGGKEKALERILDIAIQFAWGLHYAHEKGVVHQDVKPANVMMTEDGSAKVTDFGLAKARAEVGEAVTTGANQSILVSSGGMTPAYCSPEQANKQSLSRKTDIWSWGLSVLEMFAGEVFWRAGQAAPEALDSFLNTGAEDESIPKMPDGLAEFLQQCFGHNPDDRPKDMQEVSAKLIEIYKSTVGQQYERPEPEPTNLLADSLNNKALSMLDIGKHEEALQFLDEALKIESTHPEATYNRGLILWHSARLSDTAFVTQLEEIKQSQIHPGRIEYLLGLVHIERGDAERAVEELGEALRHSGENTEISAALKKAQGGLNKWARYIRTFKGHTDYVESVAISADARYGLSGSCDKTLRLWDLATGECIRTFEGHTDYVYSVAISADARYGLSGSRDNTLRLWDLATGECIRTFEGHTNSVKSVAITAHARYGLSGSVDNTLRLWDLATGECIRAFKEHTYSVYSVAITADARYGLSGSYDKTLRLWDLATGECIRAFEGHTDYVESVAITADARYGLSGSCDKTLRLWDLATGECIRVFEGHTYSVRVYVAITADARYSLSGGWDKNLRLWDLTTGECIRTFKGHTDYVESVAISADARYGLSGSEDKTLRLWDITRGEPVEGIIVKPRSTKEIEENHSLFMIKLDKARDALDAGAFKEAVILSEEARRVSGYFHSSAVRDIFQRAGKKGIRNCLRYGLSQRAFEGHTSSVKSVAISADARYGLSGSWNKTLRLWDLATGECIRVFEGHTGYVESVAITTDARYGLSGSWDKTLRLWDLTTGECIRIFKGHTGYVESVAITADARYSLSGSRDDTLRLWDLATGECIRVFEGHTDYADARYGLSESVKSVAITADARYGLSGSVDKTLRLWDLATGEFIRAFKGHTWWVSSVAITADARYGLSGSVDKTLRLWDLATGECIRAFEGHTKDVSSVAITADARYGLSGSGDNTFRLWDLATGECIRAFEGHTKDVSSVAVTADARYALSGSLDNTLRLWEFEWQYEFPDPVDWDEGARSYLETFLTLHCPYGEDGINRVGSPVWDDNDFKKLIRDLENRGYGWLRPEGVRKKLEEMTVNWQGPPPLPGR